MEHTEICENDYNTFHELLNSYYREGEDANTPQEVIDSFIRLMFEKLVNNELYGCFLKNANEHIGFVLWTVDNENFEFSEMPGLGTILEIGIKTSCRGYGLGKELVAYVEENLQRRKITQCYVSSYGPAQNFWRSCGYKENGFMASNGLPVMIKTIVY